MIGSILTILAVAQLGLGLKFIFGYQRSQTLVWYGLFTIGVGLYVGANGLGYLKLLLTQSQAEHLAWAAAAIVATFILPFSFSFPLKIRTVRELLPWVLWPLVIFIPGILWTNAFILQEGIVNFGNGYATSRGVYFPFFIFFFAAYWLWSIVNFIRSYLVSDGIHRQQLRIFLIGLCISILISSYFDIFLPLTNTTNFGYVGSLATSIWFGFTAYILLRK